MVNDRTAWTRGSAHPRTPWARIPAAVHPVGAAVPPAVSGVTAEDVAAVFRQHGRGRMTNTRPAIPGG